MNDESIIEIWRNKGRGLFIATKLSNDGTDRHEPIPGGREFQVLPTDRRHHQSLCRTDGQDPYSNGQLQACNDAAKKALQEIAVARVANPWSTAARMEEAASPATGAIDDDGPVGAERVPETPVERIARLRAELAAAETAAGEPSYQVLPQDPEPAAPASPVRPSNSLSDEEEETVLRGHGNKAKAILKRLDSSVALGLLHATALTESTPGRVDLIAKRWLEVDPNVKIANTDVVTSMGGDPDEEQGPQLTDPDESGPKAYDLAGIDGPGGAPAPDAAPDGPMSLAGREGYVAPD
jgi:hypothetical protein